MRALIRVDLAQPLVQNSFPLAPPHWPCPRQRHEFLASLRSDTRQRQSASPMPMLFRYPRHFDLTSRHAETFDAFLKRGAVDRPAFTAHLLSIPEPLRPTRVAVHSAKSQGRALQQIDVAIAEAQAYWEAAVVEGLHKNGHVMRAAGGPRGKGNTPA